MKRSNPDWINSGTQQLFTQAQKMENDWPPVILGVFFKLFTLALTEETVALPSLKGLFSTLTCSSVIKLHSSSAAQWCLSQAKKCDNLAPLLLVFCLSAPLSAASLRISVIWCVCSTISTVPSVLLFALKSCFLWIQKPVFCQEVRPKRKYVILLVRV